MLMVRKIFTLFITALPHLLTSQVDSVNNLPCANREFNVVVHVFRSADGNVGISQSSVVNNLKALDNAFSPICISFKLCDFRIHDNYNFAIWDDNFNRPEAQAIYFEKKQINVFLVDSLAPPLPQAGGYASYQGIAMQDKPFITITKKSGSGVWIHEFGHFFGLLHTFATNNGAELVNGSNCATAGDGVCDTPADPYPDGAIITPCKFASLTVDANGEEYLPMVENYMSYYPCACKFTRGQYLRMYQTYISSPEAHW